MRRRNKPRVVWLPQTNDFSLQSLVEPYGYQVFSHTIGGAAGAQVVSLAPLTIDEPSDVATATTTLADIENSGYRLRRIVGKVFCSAEKQLSGTDFAWATVICTAGIIVLRVDPTTDAPLAIPQNYHPGFIVNWSDPWIWRRTWLLSNIEPQYPDSVANLYPASNAEYGSVQDGPHVDQKTARIISNEERLYLVAATTIFNSENDQLASDVNWLFDLRCLASMRTSLGNRRNASR